MYSNKGLTPVIEQIKALSCDSHDYGYYLCYYSGYISLSYLIYYHAIYKY